MSIYQAYTALCKRLVYSLLLVAGVLSFVGCHTETRRIVTPVSAGTSPRRVISYKGLAYNHGYTKRVPLLVPIAQPDPQAFKPKAAPVYTSAVAESVPAQSSTAAQTKAAGKNGRRENESLTARANYSTEALDADRMYASIQQMYQVDEQTDDAKMRAFKAMKDSLDATLARNGYTQKQIKQFYILNYLGAQQANQPAQQKPASGSSALPLDRQRRGQNYTAVFFTRP